MARRQGEAARVGKHPTYADAEFDRSGDASVASG